MRIWILTLALSLAAYAQEPPTPAPLSEQERLTIENMQLRFDALLVAICEKRDLLRKECNMDLQAGTVSKRPPTPTPKADASQGKSTP